MNRTKEEIENEACRRVLVALCGSEEKAEELAQAVQALEVEEPLVARVHQMYDEADRRALEVAREYEPNPPVIEFTGELEPELSPEEEREFLKQLDAIYARAQEEVDRANQ